MTNPTTLSVVNPTVERYGADMLNLATRLDSLSGKTIGLLWNGKPNGDEALKATRDGVQARAPGARFRFYSGSEPCSAELLERAQHECDAVIAASGD